MERLDFFLIPEQGVCACELSFVVVEDKMRDVGQSQAERQRRGIFVCVLFFKSAMFIFRFFGFEAWAPNCKGNTND